MTISEVVIATVTPRKPSACSCATCREMCQRAPCLGTPQDIERLIAAGYGPSMVRTLWLAIDGVPPIEMVQLRGLNQQEDGSQTCCMYEAGRCKIHALKPTEGVLSYHEPTPLENSPTLAVALTWALRENQPLVQRIFALCP